MESRRESHAAIRTSLVAEQQRRGRASHRTAQEANVGRAGANAAAAAKSDRINKVIRSDGKKRRSPQANMGDLHSAVHLELLGRSLEGQYVFVDPASIGGQTATKRLEAETATKGGRGVVVGAEMDPQMSHAVVPGGSDECAEQGGAVSLAPESRLDGHCDQLAGRPAARAAWASEAAKGVEVDEELG
jgi:hypothetical protein